MTNSGKSELVRAIGKLCLDARIDELTLTDIYKRSVALVDAFLARSETASASAGGGEPPIECECGYRWPVGTLACRKCGRRLASRAPAHSAPEAGGEDYETTAEERARFAKECEARPSWVAAFLRDFDAAASESAALREAVEKALVAWGNYDHTQSKRLVDVQSILTEALSIPAGTISEGREATVSRIEKVGPDLREALEKLRASTERARQEVLDVSTVRGGALLGSELAALHSILYVMRDDIDRALFPEIVGDRG